MGPIFRTALLTINQFESGAVDDHLSSLGWRKMQSPTSRSRYSFGWQTVVWRNQSEESEIHHAAMRISGNITALMVVTETFLRSDVIFNNFVLFGCAGVIPGSSLVVGDPVLVSSATYAENGRAYHGEIKTANGSEKVEAVGIKISKLQGFSIELADGALYSLKTELSSSKRPGVVGLNTAKALCVDKVLQVEKQPSNYGNQKNTELTYAGLVETSDYQIVDMETFGFLWALEEYKQNCIVIRILTDELGNHSASTHSSQGRVKQEELLRENVHVLTDAIEHLEAIARRRTEAVTKVSHDLEDVLPEEPADTKGSMSAIDRFVEHTRIWLGNWSSRRDKALQIDNYLRSLASMHGLSRSDLDTAGSELYPLIQNLRYAGRTGYAFSGDFGREGLKRDASLVATVSRLLVAGAEEGNIGRSASSDEFLKEILRRVTPSSSEENYARLLRSFGRNYAIENFQVLEVKNEKRGVRQAVVEANGTSIMTCSSIRSELQSRRERSVEWNGGSNDADLLTALGLSNRFSE